MTDKERAAVQTLADVTMQCIDITEMHHWAIGVLGALLFLVAWIAVAGRLNANRRIKILELNAHAHLDTKGLWYIND